MYCYGCDIQSVDGIIVVTLHGSLLGLMILGNHSKVKNKDALLIVREWNAVWIAGATIMIVAFILFLTDPGQIYSKGIFNWRSLVILASAVPLYIQTIHQIVKSRRLKKQLLLVHTINYEERFGDVIRDKVLYGRLKMFLDTELSSEIYQFLEAVQDFKQNYGKEGNQRRARIILDMFIIRGARFEINIESDLRFRLTNKLLIGNVPIDVFDDCENAMKRALFVDGFARFLQQIGKEELEKRRNSKTWALPREISKRFVVSSSMDYGREKSTGGDGAGMTSVAVDPSPSV
jgi:Regulator of G protein signaling domain